MNDKTLQKLEDIISDLFLTKDMICIVIDFFERECPTKNNENINISLECYANRSRMFFNLLEAAYRNMLNIDDKLTQIISNKTTAKE